MASEAFELGAHTLVVAVEDVSPASVPELGGPVGGIDEVSEQHCGQDPLGAGPAPGAGDELLDLVEHRAGVADPVDGISPGQLDVPEYQTLCGVLSVP